MFSLILTALVLLFLGALFPNNWTHEHPVLIFCYWLACAWLTFTAVLLDAGVRISMDGKGRCLDNVFVERLWRSLKYEDVYLRRYGLMPEAAIGIGRYIKFFNSERPHQSFQFQTPDSVFEQSLRGRSKIAA